MGAQVLDMTGRELSPGESVTEYRSEQQEAAEARDFWDSVPDMVRYLADNQFDHLDYPDVVELVVHSLLTEAEQAAEEHERAADVLEFIRGRFFSPDEEAGDV